MSNVKNAGAKWDIRWDALQTYNAEAATIENEVVTVEDSKDFIGIALARAGNLKGPIEILPDGAAFGRPGMLYKTYMQPNNSSLQVTVYVSAFPSDTRYLLAMSSPAVKSMEERLPAFKVVAPPSYDSGWLHFTTFGELKTKLETLLQAVASMGLLPSCHVDTLASSSNSAAASSISLLEEKGGIKSVGIPGSGGAEVPLVGKGLTETGAHAALKEKESRIADSMLASVIPKTHPLYNKCADVLVDKNLTTDAMVAALAIVFEDNQRLSHELQQLKTLLESGGNAAAMLPSKVKEADEQRARADQLDAQLHQAKQEHREHLVLEDEHARKMATTLKSLSPADMKLLQLVLTDISTSGADKQAGYFNPFVNLVENPDQIRARGAPILRELEAKGYRLHQPPVAAASAAAATPTAYVDLAGKEHIAGVAADEQKQAERLQELAGVMGFERV
jgi:hypothetical protein